MMSIEWAKPVATEILVIRMSRFFAKWAVNWIMEKCFYIVLLKADERVGLFFGPQLTISLVGGISRSEKY